MWMGSFFCEGMCSSVWSVQCWASALRHSCYEQACAGKNWKTASWNTPTNITSLISTLLLFFFPSNLLHFYNGFGYLSQQWLSFHKVEYLILKLTKKRGFLTNSSHMELWSNLSFILCEVCGKLCEYHLLALASCLHLWLLCTCLKLLCCIWQLPLINASSSPMLLQNLEISCCIWTPPYTVPTTNNCPVSVKDVNSSTKSVQ
jgi:hypothetical protein